MLAIQSGASFPTLPGWNEIRRRAMHAAVGLAVFASPAAAFAQAAKPTLTVALTGVSTVPQDWLMAEALGYFDKAGVSVTLRNYNASGTAIATSGQVPLVIQGAGGAMSASVKGMNVRVVYSQQYGDPPAAITVAARSSYKTPLELAGKRIGTVGSAGSCWGSAALYSQYIMGKGGQALQPIPFSSPAALNAALSAGQIEAIVCNAEAVAKNVEAGNFRIMLPASNPIIESLVKDAVQVVVWGTQQAINDNADAITRALGAVQAAARQIPGWSVQYMASQMVKLPVFAGYSEKDIELQLAQSKPFVTRNDGMISADQWATTLEVYQKYGLGIDLSSPSVSYDQLVDMRFDQGGAKYRDEILAGGAKSP